jgi:glycosyltransferase involved in cell wall biosynthesis
VEKIKARKLLTPLWKLDDAISRIQRLTSNNKPSKIRISCAMIAWNEENTIDLSLKSIKNLADEVVIADTGSFDGTVKKALDCLDKFDLSGEVLRVKSHSLGEARLAAFDKCSENWILLMDSNLVLSEALKKEMLDASRKGYVSLVSSLNLMGDYEHYFTPLPFHGHHNTLFRRDHVKWKETFDRPTLSFLAKRREIKHWAVNLSRVRPAWRYWYRGEAFDPKHSKNRDYRTDSNIQYKWLRSVKYPSLVEYVKSEMGLTLNDVKNFAPSWFLDLVRKYSKPLELSMKEKLPEVIKEELSNPRYTLIYENGNIVGRHPKL